MQNNFSIFDNKFRFLILIIIGFIISVSFKLHGLSVNEWDKYLPSEKYSSNNVLIGKSQGIRSDEWLVSTPFIFSQIKHEFSKNNLNIGVDNATLIVHYNLPIYHFISLFKPQNYGFFFLDDERGFSFLWNYKVFGLLFSTFLLLMIFTENNFLLSTIGGGLVWLSSFNQWWFSIPLPEIIISFNMFIVFFAYFINARNKIYVILYPLCSIYFFINFALSLYPPFQIILGYLALLLMGIVFFEYYKNKNYTNILLKIGMSIFCLIALSLFFYYYYIDIKTIVNIIMNTEYPGDRKLLGGGINLSKYFSGYYDFYYSSSIFPKSYGNVCEASNFYFLFPCLIPLLVVSIFKKHISIDYKIWLLMFYIAIVSIWIFFGFNETIAHVTLFEKVQPQRAFLGIGIADILITMIFINWLSKKELSISYSLEYYIIIFFILVLLGKFMQVFNDFYTDIKIIISAFIFSLIVYTIYTRRFLLFIILLGLVYIPNFFINPLVYGIPQFKEKELANFINTNNFEKKQWLAYDNNIIPMYLKALGLDVINGVDFIPNFNKLSILDIDKSNEKIYNRYAHIVVKPLFNEKDKINFQLKQSDLYEIHINPCNNALKILNVKYFILPNSYFQNISNINECGLRLINDKPLNNYNIYERLDM